jgi:thymidylate synthase
MSSLVVGETIRSTWLSAVDVLHTQGSQYDLIAEVSDTAEPSTVFVDAINALLVQSGHQSLDAVANTIFPQWLAESSTARVELYDRYNRLLPLLRKLRGNRHGTYFGRMIAYPPAGFNQLEHTAVSLSREEAIRGLRHAFELMLYAPGVDSRPMGFPCLSAISIHREGPRLRLAATYRNQYYFERALGNLIGLSRLQRWLAREAGLAPGILTMHAFHAELDATESQTRSMIAIGEATP